MDFPTKEILAVVGGVIAVVVTIATFFDLAPRLRLRISSRVLDANAGKIVIRLEVENLSKVLVIHHPEKRSLFQVVRFRLAESQRLTEFLPFRDEDLTSDHMNNPIPEGWSEAEKVLTTTSHWYPGDIVCVERIETVEEPDTVLHVGLQVNARVPFPIHLLLKLRSIGRKVKAPERWTTTVFISSPIPSKN